MPIDPGTRFDRYRILAPLGSGGMGEVYLAQDTKLGRKVALKLLPERYTQDPKRLRRFEQEARAASALNHPNIITIHEIGEVGGVHFIATEFIEGITLRKRLRQERLSIKEALDVAIQVANALVAAHSASIVHRDIKPENVMLRPDGYVKVLDFGLAKLIEQSVPAQTEAETRTTGENADEATGETSLNRLTDDSEMVSTETIDQATVARSTVKPFANELVFPVLDQTSPTEVDTAGAQSLSGHPTQADAPLGQTVPGLVMGTLHYMSPEQVRGLRIDTRTDIFSLGVMIYEMLAGQMPFEGRVRKDIMAAILSDEPLPITRLRPETPDLLEWITAKALIKEREERYQTAREMLNDLKRLTQRLDVETELARNRRGLEDSGGAEAESARDSGSQRLTRDSAGNPIPQDAAQNQVLSTQHFKMTEPSGPNFYPVTDTASVRRQRTLQNFLIAIPLLLLSGYLIYNFVISRKTPPLPFSQMKVTRFTSSGKALRAALSPDGKYVVYAAGDTRQQRLLVQQVTTAGLAEAVPATEAIYRGLTFAPDSNSIFYVVQEGNNPTQTLYQVPVLGGAPRKVLTEIDSAVSFAPDGKRLAFVRRSLGAKEDLLIIADPSGNELQRLAVRKGAEFFQTTGLAWSPNGKTIVCPAGTNEGGRHLFYVAVDAVTGQMRKLAETRWSNAGQPAWLPSGQGLIVSGIESGTTQAQIWQITFPQGRVQRLTNGLNDYRDLSIAADAHTLIAVQTEAQVNIWITPQGAPGQPKQITSGIGQYNGVRGLGWTPDGRLTYVSRQSGSQDVWIMNGDGTQPRQLTTPETRADVYPVVTPDGQTIVFVSTRTGSSNLYSMALDGTNQKQLTNGTSDEFPVITGDGRAVIYTMTGSTLYTLWRVPIKGGQPVQLTDHLSQWPAASPDGKWIACWYRQETKQPWRLALLPATGGAPMKTLALPASADSALPVRWLPMHGPDDAGAICFVDTRNGVSNLWAYHIADGTVRQLTDFNSDLIFWFDIAPDGKQIATSRGTLINDVLMFSLPKE
ncbi:MAG: protein kinase [Acidobacteria bacterium]|nr:protein kinase [Acidobacteriota bacterium]MBI3422900.1 protein kinase [Acidobacteriota bacterium]